MKILIQIILNIRRQLQKIFYQIKRILRLIIQNKSSNKAESEKVGRNSHGFPTILK
jgi:hypothetical protein